MTYDDREKRRVMVNREPVLTLWPAVVAEVLGFDSVFLKEIRLVPGVIKNKFE